MTIAAKYTCTTASDLSLTSHPSSNFHPAMLHTLLRPRPSRPLRVTVLPGVAPPWAAWRAPPARPPTLAARTGGRIASPNIAAVTAAVLVLAGALLAAYRRETTQKFKNVVSEQHGAPRAACDSR